MRTSYFVSGSPIGPWDRVEAEDCFSAALEWLEPQPDKLKFVFVWAGPGPGDRDHYAFCVDYQPQISALPYHEACERWSEEEPGEKS